MFKNKIVRLLLCAALALPIGYAVFQPTEAQAAWFHRYRPIYRPAPIVNVAPVVTVAPGAVVPIAPVYRYYGGYRWHWNGYRWVR